MKAFEELYSEFQKDIYHFLLHICNYDDMLAEELTQETFYQAFLSLDRFRGECTIKTWLCQIAKNTYYRYLRHQVRQEKLVEKIDCDNIQPSFTKDVEERQSFLQIKKIIETLDEQSRNVVEYRLFGELPFKDIGYLLGIREATAKVVFSRAKVKIQKQLKEEYGYEI